MEPTTVELATTLREGGGWGLSVILMLVVAHLYRKLQAKDERIYRLLDRQADVLRALEYLRRRVEPAPRDRSRE